MTEPPMEMPLAGANGPDPRLITDAEEYVGGVSALVEKLHGAAASLPEVAPDGSSECPFAGELHARSEELERQLSAEVIRLREHLEALEEKLQRCREELNVISQDKSQLASDEAIDQYSQAEQEQRDKCLALAQERSALLEVIGRAVAALAASRSKKYPGKNPEDNPIYPGAALPMGLVPLQPALHAPSSGPAPGQAPDRVPSPVIGALVRLGPLSNNGWHRPP